MNIQLRPERTSSVQAGKSRVALGSSCPQIWTHSQIIRLDRNEATSSEKVLETVHEQVRQYLSRAATAAWRSTRHSA